MTAREYTPLPPIVGGDVSQTEVPSIDKINTIPLEELLPILRNEMHKLSKIQDINKTEAEAPLNYIYFSGNRARTNRETAMFDFYIEVKFSELYRKILKNHFYEYCENPGGPLSSRIKGLIHTIWNTSDKSDAFCDDFVKTGLHKDYFTYLKTDFFSNSKIENYIYEYTCKAFLSTLHNVLQKSALGREAFRAVGGVEVFQLYRSSTNQMAACLALMAQGYLVTEEENDKLNSDLKVFEYMVSILNAASQQKSIHSTIFSIEEVVDAINKLAVNDNNKKMIIEAGTLKYYVAFLKHEYNCSLDATAMAAHGIWILGFKCRDELVNYDGCLQALRNLLTHSNEKISKEAEGALWILEEKAPMTTRNEEKVNQHVFISYQWDVKKTVLKVRDYLKRNGVKTWIDEDDMSGSVLDAMATAVENASVVLICLSQKYKDSPNCRTEAEYTFRLRKPVIPLRLQTNYMPDGWLGILVGNKLYFDFSVASKYDDSNRNLLKEIQNLKNEVSSEMNAMPQRKSNSTHEKSNPVRKWTKDDIDEWMTRNKINHLSSIFSKFDGDMLIEYAQMKEEAPDAFYMSFIFKNMEIYDSLLVKMALKEIL